MMRECEAESFWCQKDPSISKRSHWSRQKITNAPHRSGHFISPVGFVHLLFLSIRLSFHFQFTRPHSFRSAPPQPGSHEKHPKKRDSTVEAQKLSSFSAHFWEWNLWPFQLRIFAQEGWGVLNPFHHFISFHCLSVAGSITPVLRCKSCLV